MTSSAAASERTTPQIDDDADPHLLRRPGDVVSLVVAMALMAFVFGGAYLATDASAGLNEDVVAFTSRVPRIIVTIANTVVLVGAVALPLGVVAWLVSRRQLRQVASASGAFGLGLVVTTALNDLLVRYGSAHVVAAAGGLPQADAAPPLSGLLTALVAMCTVARVTQWSRLAGGAAAVVAAMVFAELAAQSRGAAGVTLSLLLGWALGLLVRYLLGTPSSRPSATAVAAALAEVGWPVTALRSDGDIRGGRRYSATTADGSGLDVLVLDRDLEADGLLRIWWHRVWVRGSSDVEVSLERRVDRLALSSLAMRDAGVHTARQVVATQVGADATVLAFEHIAAASFADLGGRLTDADLDAAWAAAATLAARRICHRSLTGANVLRADDGTVWLRDAEAGGIAASDLALRLDLAELLCTLALLTDADRAVASGTRVLGAQHLQQALPVLQPVGLAPETRTALHQHKSLLTDLQNRLAALHPTPEAGPIELQRLKPQTIFALVGGAVAVYLMLTTFAKVNFSQLAADAQWWWIALGLALSATTYLGAGMCLRGFIPAQLSLLRTIIAQVASSFATLVTPPSVGVVTVNLRFLQKSGVPTAIAAAGVAVSDVLTFVVHIVMLTVFALLAGQSITNPLSDVPSWAFGALAAVVAVVALSLLIPAVRRLAAHRLTPVVAEVGPQLLTLAQRPRKLAEGIGGIIILNSAYCLCLFASVRAFGGQAGFFAVAAVYMAGAAVGSATPIPGGVGTVELALTVGLTAIGLTSGLAASAALTFRFLTFWLPVIPGWLAFRWLERERLL